MTDSPPSARFGLLLLGRFELTGPEGVVDLPSKKLAGLLAYLACTAPQPQPRERLSALLWGSHFDAQAKQNLRQALFRLRKVLGQDVLESDGEVVSLNAAAVLCDVSRFEALVREGGRDALSAAADLYRGRLIDDVTISEEGWSEWLTGERERLLELALGAMVGLGEQELAAGRAEHALKAAQRAIALNTMREDAHRLIVQALAATGRKAEALKHYQDLVALLKHELNTEPDAATRSLVAELRSTQPPSKSPAVREIAKPAPPHPDRPSIAVLPTPNMSRDAPEQKVNTGNPAARGEALSSAVAVRSGSPERRDRMKVLIVDDHALIREALHAVVKQLKHEAVIFEASNSRQAMRIVEEHPDLGLILLDINLPDRDGFSVLSELRERHATIAIIILSALDDQDKVKHAFSLGALGFIPKTTEREVMLNAIELVLSGGLYIPSAVLDREEPNAGTPAARGEEASSAAAVRSGSRERRQLTIMVCNLVGSAPLDPEDMHDLIATFHKMAADVVARFDGFVARYLGDGVHVYFGYPAAHEHDAEQAVRAGLALVDAVGTKAVSDVPIQARVGIATGIVVVGEPSRAGDTRQRVAIGDAPDLAARLQAAASPGAVVIAASTRRLVGRMFDCHALGADTVKGLPQSVGAWQVRGETAGVSRFGARRADALTPLVGRQEEIDRLLRRWDQAKVGGGQVVLLSGEPGIGKSRIAESLLAGLEGEPHARLRYFCSPHHAHSPLYPFITQLEQAASFEPGSAAKAKLDRLEALLKPSARNAPRDVALIAELLAVPGDDRYPALAVSPQQKREMTLTALLDQLDGAAAQGPVLIVFEDVHWIDPTSQDLLDRTVARIANLPVLLVVTVRPELQPAWVGQPHVTMLPLSRLGRRDSAGVIAGITRDKALPDAVVEQVLAHTDGVPLFIEESTSTLLESGLLRETPDRYVLDGPLPRLAIPTTLHASLVARLDRLASVKDVAQIGAAIGREFSHTLIAAMSALAPMELDAALERLTAAGLISRRGTPPDATYSFKHALIQDAAYQSLLKSKRQQYHQHIAEVLERQLTGIVDIKPELLAHHMTEAGLYERAVVCWQKAGEWAMQRSANVEAVSHLTMGRKLLNNLPRTPGRTQQELTLLLALGAALTVTKGWATPEAEDVYTRARVLCQQDGDAAQLFPVLLALHRFHALRGELQLAHGVGEQLLRLAQRADDPTLLLPAHVAHGYNCFFRGDLTLARTHLEQGMTFYDAKQHNFWISRWGEDPGIVGLGFGALTLWSLGFPDKALAWSGEELALASKTTHSFSLAFSLWIAARLHQVRREVETVEERVKTMMALSVAQGFLAWIGHGMILRGWTLCMRGHGEEGIVQMQQGLAAELSAGANLHRTHYLALLAEAYGALGRHEEGLTTIADAVAVAEKTGEGYSEPELHRVKGVLLLQQGARDEREIETCFRRAIDVARGRSAKSLELRAATSLASLWQSQGKKAEAQRMLGKIYGRFTEGFGTTDLQEAKALLEALA
jgi:class 3 adenylate cyclase/DNA-binding SARP family transcriptional activator/predicted ATPase